MDRYKVINYSSISLLLLFLVFSTTALFAQKIVESGEQSAGFIYATDSDGTEPIIHYQQNIDMLSSITDKASLSVFSDGRVLVHFPVYMKKTGDYEMRLDDVELKHLIKSLSDNGIMDFDEKKVKTKVIAYRKSLKDKGQLYAISDATVTVVDIKLNEYQKNNKSKKIANFHKQFKWKNIEHDAARYKRDTDITKANNSIIQLKGFMHDARLIERKHK